MPQVGDGTSGMCLVLDLCVIYIILIECLMFILQAGFDRSDVVKSPMSMPCSGNKPRNLSHVLGGGYLGLRRSKIPARDEDEKKSSTAWQGLIKNACKQSGSISKHGVDIFFFARKTCVICVPGSCLVIT